MPENRYQPTYLRNVTNPKKTIPRHTIGKMPKKKEIKEDKDTTFTIAREKRMYFLRSNIRKMAYH